MHHCELIIKARHLDTDAKQFERVELVRPRGEAAQRTQIIETVSELHPRARFRSFGNGAATFLEADHLIVAYYGDELVAAERREPAASQQPLFGV